jgi:hypothetical protein
MQQLNQFIENNFVLIILSIGVVLVVLLVLMLVFYLRLRKTPYDIFDEKEAKNLEDILVFQSKTIKALDKDIQELFNISNKINALSSRGLHKTGLVRFNPFKDVGGDQSFSLALLNGKNNGLVLTSLYTRESTRIYVKSIIDAKSKKRPLTEEEERAIKIALKKESNFKKKKK